MFQKYTNSSIAQRIEFYYFYFTKISTNKAISDNLAFQIDNPNLNKFLEVSELTGAF